MRSNINLAIVGKHVVLMPYREEHVKKYHEWMTDPELREQTASEQLTLDEEFEMQRKWQEDEDKLTFIITAQEPGWSQKCIDQCTTMIGDVNLFFKGLPNDEDYEVEAEIMIAEKSFRRRGMALEALQLMLSFAATHLYPPHFPVAFERFVARIGTKNEASQKMFAKLGFEITKVVEVFEEVEMRPKQDASLQEWNCGLIATI